MRLERESRGGRIPSSSAPTNTCGCWSLVAPTSAAGTSSRTRPGRAPEPGHLLLEDAEGGEVYVQVVVDTFSSLAYANCYSSPRTNGFVEPTNRTLLDECFRAKARETFYLSIAEIPRDPDAFLRLYGLARSRPGYGLTGRAPAQALREALGVETLPSLAFQSIDETSIVTAATKPEEAEIEPANVQTETTLGRQGVGESLDLYARRDSTWQRVGLLTPREGQNHARSSSMASSITISISRARIRRSKCGAAARACTLNRLSAP